MPMTEQILGRLIRISDTPVFMPGQAWVVQCEFVLTHAINGYTGGIVDAVLDSAETEAQNIEAIKAIIVTEANLNASPADFVTTDVRIL